jgi:hypothetical protein
MRSRRIVCAGHVARMGKIEMRRKLVVGKPERKRLLGKPKDR